MRKFSLIVPVYNVEKYLEKCLDSIYKLDLKDKEIILVNDGSTDNSLNILEKYNSLYPENTKLISQKNQGLSEARNTGIRNSNGDYLLFIDSDDFIDSEVTERFLQTSYQYSSDILIGDYLEYFSDSDIRKRNHYKVDKNFESNGLFFIEEGFKNRCLEVVAWKNIYRKQFLLENNLFFKKGLLHEDNLFTPITFSLAKKVRYFNGDEFYYYRQNNSASIMKTKSEKNYRHMLYIIDELLKFIENREIKNSYFNRLILSIYLILTIEGKYKNKHIFNKLKKLKFNFRELIKIQIIKIYSLNCKELKEVDL